MNIIGISLFFWWSLFGLVLSDFPASPCFLENQACDSSDIVETIINVEDKETCRDLCHNDTRCMFFTYYGEDSFPLNKVCMILATCDSLYSCDDCYSEDSYCFRSCGDTIEAQIGENLLSIISTVDNVTQCKFLCAETQNCSYFTFYNQHHEGLPSTCFLLEFLTTPFKRCENCVTSPADCLGQSICGFLTEQNEPIPSSQIFTNSSQISTLWTIRLGKCGSNLRILTVGGGGGRGCFSGGICGQCSGGGSGYVYYNTMDVDFSVKISVSVGRAGKPSQVVLGTSTLVAGSGEDGTSGDRGGNGYSGGGGSGRSCLNHPTEPAGDGGCDGENGKSGSEGRGGYGSSVDLASYQFEKFQLRSGKI